MRTSYRPALPHSHRAAVRRPPPASALIMLTAAVLSCGGNGGKGTPAPPAAGAKLVARVNGVEISEGVLEQAMELYVAQRPQTVPPPTPEQRLELHRDLLEALINQELLLQKAAAAGIEAPADELDRRLQTLQSRYGSREEMEKGLQAAHMDVEKVRRLLERNLRIDGYVQRQVRSGIQISSADVEAYYRAHPEEMNRPEGVRASHILIRAEEGKASPQERQAARQRAGGLWERVRSGEDFAALARQRSEDASASRGGDLGYFARGGMTPAFERAAFALKVGAVSSVVETPSGYHIIKVTDHQPARIMKLEEIREPLRRKMLADEAEKRSRALLESLRAESKIERF
jgi:peptidyl-prolyl cis-trans isomerase C